MFSSIGSIFATQPRQAETTDTRQGIRRHDPDHERRKNKKRNGEDELFDQQDNATVSVEALNLFLQNFLKSLETNHKNSSGTNPDDIPHISDEAQKQQTHATSGRAAQAASAYQATARTTKRTASILDSTDETAPEIKLEGEEIRTIHALLSDLTMLMEKNIEYVHIQRSENFLQSLVNAVTHAKNI